MKTLDSLAAGKDVPGDVDDDKEWGQKSPPPWFDQAKFDRYTLLLGLGLEDLGIM